MPKRCSLSTFKRKEFPEWLLFYLFFFFFYFSCHLRWCQGIAKKPIYHQSILTSRILEEGYFGNSKCFSYHSPIPIITFMKKSQKIPLKKVQNKNFGILDPIFLKTNLISKLSIKISLHLKYFHKQLFAGSLRWKNFNHLVFR